MSEIILAIAMLCQAHRHTYLYGEGSQKAEFACQRRMLECDQQRGFTDNGLIACVKAGAVEK